MNEKEKSKIVKKLGIKSVNFVVTKVNGRYVVLEDLGLNNKPNRTLNFTLCSRDGILYRKRDVDFARFVAYIPSIENGILKREILGDLSAKYYQNPEDGTIIIDAVSKLKNQDEKVTAELVKFLEAGCFFDSQVKKINLEVGAYSYKYDLSIFETSLGFTRTSLDTFVKREHKLSLPLFDNNIEALYTQANESNNQVEVE